MDAKQKALAQLQHWNLNGYSPQDAVSWGTVAGPQQAKKAPTRGRGGYLSSLISELGGAGGAAGGAAAGAAAGSVLPGIGTVIGGLVGAGIGGFAGGTAGRGVENKIRDNQNFFGKGGSAKAALTEGALAGTLSAAIPGAGALLRGGGKAGLGGLESVGRSIQTGGLGIAQGATAKGIDGIGAQRSDQLLKVLKGQKIKLGSPEATQRALEPKLNSIGESVAKRYADANVALSPQELNALGDSIIGKVTTQGGLDKSAENFAMEQVQRLVKNKDVHGLWKFTQDLEKNSINFGRGASSASPAKDSVAQIVRKDVRSFLDAKVPGVAKDNKLYHDLTDANKLLIKASANAKSGVASRVMGLGPVKAAETKVGGALSGAGKLSAGTGGPLTKITQQAKFQAPGNLAQAIGGAVQPQEAPQDPNILGTQNGDPNQQQVFQTNPDGSYSPTGPNDTTDSFTMGQAQAQAPQSQYPLEAAIADMQRDPKHAAQYQTLYKFIQDSQPSSGGPNVGKVSAQQYQLAQQGLNSLGQLSQVIQSDPNVLTRSATPGRNLPIVGGYITKSANTGQFDTLAFSAISSLLRAQSGAAVPDSEVRSYMSHYLPRAGDTPQVAQKKLQTLQYAFQTVLQGANGQSSAQAGPSNLASLLQGVQ